MSVYKICCLLWWMRLWLSFQFTTFTLILVESLLSVSLMTTHFKGKWYVVFLFCITFGFFPGINHYLMFYLIKLKKKLYQAFPWRHRINIKPFISSYSLETVEFQYMYWIQLNIYFNIYTYIFFSLGSSVWLHSGPLVHACCTAVVGEFPASSSWDFPSPPSCVGSGFLKICLPLPWVISYFGQYILQ